MPNDKILVVDDRIERVDWTSAKADLTADSFDNGRTAAALRRSFEQSQHVAFAWLDGRLVGMARMLSDGVSNAYLLDVWTRSAARRRGVATAMVRHLQDSVPGQHIGTPNRRRPGVLRQVGLHTAAAVHESGRRRLARQCCQQVVRPRAERTRARDFRTSAVSASNRGETGEDPWRIYRICLMHVRCRERRRAANSLTSMLQGR
jgi:Acetyltransferase (GNAT) family